MYKRQGYITNEELLVDKKFFDLIQGNGIIWGFVSGAESTSAKFVLEKFNLKEIS